MGRLTLVMTTMMFLQEAFLRPTWEGSGTHVVVMGRDPQFEKPWCRRFGQ